MDGRTDGRPSFFVFQTRNICLRSVFEETCPDTLCESRGGKFPRKRKTFIRFRKFFPFSAKSFIVFLKTSRKTFNTQTMFTALMNMAKTMNKTRTTD